MENCKLETSCGKVTEAECDEIKRLYHRKIALQELFQVVAKMELGKIEKIYEKVLLDMGDTSTKFQDWWDTTAKKYGWVSIEGANWKINFSTCEVSLVHP